MQPTPPNTSHHSQAPAILTDERAQRLIADLEQASRAAFALLHELTQSRTDGDDWVRLPAPARKGKGDPGGRCPVSHFSRSKIIRLIEADKIRDKHVGKARFYSLSDMRSLIRNIAANN